MMMCCVHMRGVFFTSSSSAIEWKQTIERELLSARQRNMIRHAFPLYTQFDNTLIFRVYDIMMYAVAKCYYYIYVYATRNNTVDARGRHNGLCLNSRYARTNESECNIVDKSCCRKIWVNNLNPVGKAAAQWKISAALRGGWAECIIHKLPWIMWKMWKMLIAENVVMCFRCRLLNKVKVRNECEMSNVHGLPHLKLTKAQIILKPSSFCVFLVLSALFFFCLLPVAAKNRLPLSLSNTSNWTLTIAQCAHVHTLHSHRSPPCSIAVSTSRHHPAIE